MLDSIFKIITWNDYLEDEDIKFIKDLIKVCIDIVLILFFIRLLLLLLSQQAIS